MAKLNLDKQESEFLDNTIGHWEKEGMLSAEQAKHLRTTYEVKGFDWMRLAKYSFWVALLCGAIAVGSLIIDDTVINWLKKLYNMPDIVISILAAFAAASFFYLGQKRQKLYPEKVYSNEALIFTGILFTACSIAYLGKAVDNGSGHFSLLFLLSVLVYGILAWRMHSGLIWLFSLISLGSWFGTETGYQTKWSDYFLGMNYPLRFVMFGMVLVVGCHVLKTQKWLQRFWTLTYVVGLLYLFVSLWLLSIFGNYGNVEKWLTINQISIFYWGLIAMAVAVGFLWYGLKSKDVIAREFGVTFLLILIYTKYFEYLWDHMNSTLFFSILALSFWLIGRKAEKIWNVNYKKNTTI